MSVDIVERFEAVLGLNPNAVALEQDGRELSYGELHRFSRSLATLFEQNGMPLGSPIALFLRNRSACLAASIGIIMGRRCLVTVNPLLPQQPLLKDLASLSVAAIIAEEKDWGSPALSDLARNAGCLGLALHESDGQLGVTIVVPPSSTTKKPRTLPGIAVEMLTSGTTGPPKRIQLELASLSHSLWAGSKYEGSEGVVSLQKSPSLLWMPLVHIGGLWNGLYQVYNGRKVLLLERFTVDRWHDAVKRYQLRFASLPPSALREVVDRDFPREDFATLRAIRCGTAPLDHQLAEAFEAKYDVPVLEAYGATEFVGGVAGWTIQDHRRFSKTKRTSVGRANPGVELRVVDPQTSEPVPLECEGLLEVRTRQVNDGRTWVRTTDRARIDSEGFLYILGRADSVINRGGFKISPENVESSLRLHPSIAEVCVVGIPDERLGHVPVAAYEVKRGAQAPEPGVLKAFLAAHLKPYEIPIRFLTLKELPRTASLKVNQAAVRELFLDRV